MHSTTWRQCRYFVCVTALVGIVLAGCGYAESFDPPAGTIPIPRVTATNHVSVRSEPGTPAQMISTVATELEQLRPRISRDFGVDPGRLRVELYASHRSFARSLWSMQRQRPQSDLDNMSSIVHGTLLLGPVSPLYLRHNLVHVYTEWVMDRLTGNRSDTLPRGTWFYDGLAEFEAYRYAPSGVRCTVGTGPPFDITKIRTARQWLALRSGPLGSLEYCLAYVRVRALVTRFGWSRIVHALRGHDPWMWAAHTFLQATAS